jgi:hypothetical protein
VEPSKDKGQSFYRWVDGEGRVHIVSSPAAIPPAVRPHAELVVLNGADSLPGEYPALGGTALGGLTSRPPDLFSFAAGFGAALVLLLVYRLLPTSLRAVSRWAIVLGAGALLTAGYLGWVRKSTGGSSAALATPAALIDDAKVAVERMNQRQADQERALREIEAEGH